MGHVSLKDSSEAYKEYAYWRYVYFFSKLSKEMKLTWESSMRTSGFCVDIGALKSCVGLK